MDKQVRERLDEAESARTGLVQAVGSLGGAAGNLAEETGNTIKRWAPVAAGVAGAAVLIGILRRR